MKYLLGVDLGTSGTKTVLFSQRGKALSQETVEYPLYQPKNGWAEQDPDDWYNAAVVSIKKVIKKSRVDPHDIAGLAIAGQMHGLVMLDKDGNVLRKAILWCDSRTGEQCKEIEILVGKKRLVEINANPALTGFTAPKILWVREHEKEIYDRCSAILLPKDYVRYRLTGKIAMEISDASGTNLLDIKQRQWSTEILQSLKIDRSLLPEIIESTDIAGQITSDAAKATGLIEGTVVAGGAGDNAAAAVGTGVCSDGQAFITLGTSGVVFAHTSKPAIDPLGRIHTFCAAVPGCWTAMSCTLAAGLSMRWMRDEFFSNEKKELSKKHQNVYDLMTRQAAKIPSGADGLIYLPYLMGERSPVLDPEARGVFFGLSARHTRAHLTRAVLEGVTLSARHNLEVLNEIGINPATLMACGGGASSKVWRQMLSDILKCNVATTLSKEGPALGVAILAGVACGIFKSVSEGCKKCVKKGTAFSKPDSEESVRYDDVYKLYTFLYPQLRPAFYKLASLRRKLDGEQTDKYPSVYSVEFERFGRIIDGVDTDGIVDLLSRTPLPENGVVYVPSESSLETKDLLADLGQRVFGGMKIQIGYCNGHNRKLNALEYHRSAEINIPQTDTLVTVAPICAIRDGIVDTLSCETFMIPARTAVLFYETTLHYTPCNIDENGYFRMCIVLPKETNTDKDFKHSTKGEASLLTHNNKWIFVRKNSPEADLLTTSGQLIGKNIEL